MDFNFLLQLLSSFSIGGFLVGIQASIAEKADKKLAGIVLTFPSTALVSFFFMWQVLGEAKFQEALIPVPITMGASLLFIFTYIKAFQATDKFITRTRYQIPLSLFIALCFWILMSFVILHSGISNIWLSLAIASIFMFMTRLLLKREELCTKPLPEIKIKLMVKIYRMIFSGFVIATTVFLAKTLGPTWGGIFSMFPAAYISSLLMYSLQYNHQFMYRTFYNAPKGLIALLIFTFATLITFPIFGNLLGTLISVSISTLSSLVIYNLDRDKA